MKIPSNVVLEKKNIKAQVVEDGFAVMGGSELLEVDEELTKALIPVIAFVSQSLRPVSKPPTSVGEPIVNAS